MIPETIKSLWIEVTRHGPVLRWRYYGPALPPPRYLVFVDGALFLSTRSTSAALQYGRAGQRQRVDVLATSDHQAATQDWSGLFASHDIGSRLRLDLPAVDLDDEPTFAGYVIYWSDDGSDPTIELAELRGASASTLTTPALVDGTTYKFRAKAKDIYGNLSDFGAIASGSVNVGPLAPTGTAAVYTQATRTAVITATKPTGQAADVVGYRLYSNHLPGHGLQPAITTAIALVGAAATLTFTTPELAAGVWRFAWRAVDSVGLESSGPVVVLSLVKSGGALVEITAPPAKPTWIDAIPIAGGKIRVSVRLATAGAGRTIKVYCDGALDGTVSTTASATDYTYETAALTHGQTYAFAATVTASSIESELSDTASAMAYATAPDVAPTITLTAVP